MEHQQADLHVVKNVCPGTPQVVYPKEVIKPMVYSSWCFPFIAFNLLLVNRTFLRPYRINAARASKRASVSFKGVCPALVTRPKPGP